jgi:hypothetical protein
MKQNSDAEASRNKAMLEQNRLKFVQCGLVHVCRMDKAIQISSLYAYTLRLHVTVTRYCYIKRGITSKSGFDAVAAKSWHVAAISVAADCSGNAAANVHDGFS